MGANAQYRDQANCLAACAYFPEGTPTDDSGNSIGCRAMAAAKAATDPSVIKPACWAAGPLSYGTCGSEFYAFCSIATSYCSPKHGYGDANQRRTWRADTQPPLLDPRV